ncbi:MAG TPA: cell division protein ZipA C-terminal FtsZ-binding domain-containing protein [Gallionellaceae bacterium]
MSELQISLLAIGILVVLSVYGYGTWQQRQYRKRFGSAFSAPHADALYQGTLARQTAGLTAVPGDEEQFLPDTHDTPDESCTTLESGTDYIAVMFASSPLHAEVLDPLWRRRLDFGKNLHICGIPAAGTSWGKVAAESSLSYDTFRLALQLADRSGAVSQTRLEDFRDLMRDIAELAHAEINLPDVAEAASIARHLDNFCAEVDQMIGLNILPSGGNLLMGSNLARAANRHGLVLQPDGAFHLLDDSGRTLFMLSNFDETPFRADELNEMPVIGLSLQLDVPRVEQPTRRFDELAKLARAIGADMGAAVVDDHRMELGDPAIAMIRSQVAAIEKKMLAYPIIPGSALARRLFS